MTELGRFLTEQQNAQGINAAQLAERLGIDPTAISKAKKGARRFWERASLIRMVNGISDDPAIKNGLMVAVLEDILNAVPGVEPEKIEIHVRDVKTQESSSAYKSTDVYSTLGKTAKDCGLDSQLVSAFISLMTEVGKNTHLRRAILGLAEMSKAK